MSDSLSSQIKKEADWGIFMGILMAAVGVVMVIYPLATATVTTLFLGWSFIIAGAANFVFAFYSPSAGPFFLKILLAILYGIAGIGLILNPAVGVLALTAALGTVLIIQAGIELAAAIEFRGETAWGSLLFDSLLSLALGLMILFQWPTSSVWAVGTMLGVGVLMAGIARIVLAATAHHGASKMQKIAHA